ncbi:hypothetical protein ACIQU6_29335 [Streptomyces sp. NPDC090442]|uniref:hypothetical protein n=1 Tax=Streptomyces sp. NPDC090442 TaxID=3365962 RepID=UPI003811F7D7
MHARPSSEVTDSLAQRPADPEHRLSAPGADLRADRAALNEPAEQDPPALRDASPRRRTSLRRHPGLP